MSRASSGSMPAASRRSTISGRKSITTVSPSSRCTSSSRGCSRPAVSLSSTRPCAGGAPRAVLHLRQAQPQFVDRGRGFLQDLRDVLGRLVREGGMVDRAGEPAREHAAVAQREVNEVHRLRQSVQLLPVPPVGGGQCATSPEARSVWRIASTRGLAVAAADQRVPGLGGVAVGQGRGAFAKHLASSCSSFLTSLRGSRRGSLGIRKVTSRAKTPPTTGRCSG